jgi:predicted metal-dependent phosphoesterase TrpH
MRSASADHASGATGGRRVDLHAHTTFSDGTLTPEALVAHARARDLATLAITDHDSIDALPHARAALAPGLELVPGVELSAAYEALDLHILGLFVDPGHDELIDRLARFRRERLERAFAILERLDRLGVPVAREQVLALAGPGVVGRPHVAEAMIRAGHAADLDDAFRRYLGMQGQAYVPRPAFRPEQAIALVHAAGGVSVLAHPGASLPDRVIERLVAIGLRGVEVWHPQHGEATIRRYRNLARRFDLLESGGSDFHSPGRGTDLGDIPVPAAALARIKQAAGVPG